jgi:hypothetical protein
MEQKLVLYSTNSRMAYQINEKFYGARHYVYCSPYFSVSSLLPWDRTNPVTSLPGDIYERYAKEVLTGDRHGPTLEANRVGIRGGAASRRAQGVISDVQEREINYRRCGDIGLCTFAVRNSP